MPGTLTDDLLNHAAEQLAKRLDAHTVILYGSGAAGLLRADSDVDFAFLSERKHDSFEIFLTAQKLAALLGREVDVVDFERSSTVLQAEIAGRGIVLVDRQPTLRQYAFMRALKSYAMLNEERQSILANLGYVEGRHGEHRQYFD